MSISSFKNVNNLSDTSPQEVVRENVISFIDWSFLKIGSYLNISIPTSGNYGGTAHTLKRVSDPRYTIGKVWEGYHKNWVWESGIGYTPEPVRISGIYINNSFTTTGFSIDYPNGRVILDSALPANSGVSVNYSHKYINVVRAEDVPFLREGHTRSFRIDETSYTSGSGIWNTVTQKRIELPCIAVETVKNLNNHPYQLGGGMYAEGDIILHVLTEDCGIADRIAGILVNQKDKTLLLFDSNYVKNNSYYPLDYKGSLVAGAKTYPQMIAWSGDGGYRTSSNIDQSKAYIIDTKGQGTYEVAQRLYHHPVRWGMQTILPASL